MSVPLTQALLLHPDTPQQLSRPPRADLPLQLAVLAIFTLHNVAGSSGSNNAANTAGRPAYSAALQRSVLVDHALCLVFAFAAVVFEAAVAALDASRASGGAVQGFAALMVAAHVMLRWLAAQPKFAAVSGCVVE